MLSNGGGGATTKVGGNDTGGRKGWHFESAPVFWGVPQLPCFHQVINWLSRMLSVERKPNKLGVWHSSTLTNCSCKLSAQSEEMKKGNP